MRAVDRRAPVIYQAAMFDGRFVGFADFLVARTATATGLRDTKLARSVKVEALLQLAAYADTLAARRRAGGRRGRAGARRRRHGELPRRRTAPGLPAAPRGAAAAARRPSRRRHRRCRWEDETSARASAARSAPSRSARTTTCCSSRACGSASAPGCIDAGVTTMHELAAPRRPGARAVGAHRRRADRAGPAAGRRPGSTASRRTRSSTRSR